MVHLRLQRLVLLAACVLCASCGARDSAISQARKGIITLAPNLTETVFALGQGGRVVAVGDFCDHPPEVKNLPRVGGFINPDLERITMLQPDLLIVSGKYQKVADYAKLHSVNVLHVHMDSLATIDAGIARIGEALGCVSEAEALRTRVRGKVDAVRKAVAGQPRPKVFIVTGRTTHDLDNLYTAGVQSFVSELVAAAGGDNIYQNASEPYPEASKEDVVLKAPEVILEFHAGEKLSEEDQRKFVQDWAQLPSLPAVKQGRVYLVLESHALRPGPRVGEIARLLAKRLHPNVDIPER